MIQANELRIGNLVLGDGLVCSITGHDIYLTESGKLKNEPIPLTREILVACGFERKSELSLEHKEHSAIRIVESRDMFMVYKGQAGAITEVKYLHQLQNLYFCLTGKELEYKP